jgi:hypothetical protein
MVSVAGARTFRRLHHLQEGATASRERHQHRRYRFLLAARLQPETAPHSIDTRARSAALPLQLRHAEERLFVVLHPGGQRVQQRPQLLQVGLVQDRQQSLVVDQPLLHVGVVQRQQSLVGGVDRLLRAGGGEPQLVQTVEGALVGVDVPVQLRLDCHVQVRQPARLGGQPVASQP